MVNNTAIWMVAIISVTVIIIFGISKLGGYTNS